MNASRQRSSGKRPIFDAFYTASGVSDVRLAAVGARLFGMRCAGEVWPLTAQQSRPLFGFGFFRCNRSKPRLTDFLSGFFGPDIPSVLNQYIGMALHEMFSLRKTLKVFKPIIGFVVIYVMDLFGWVKVFHPAFRNYTMKQVLAAYTQIAACVKTRRVWAQLSKNFSAARNSVKMAKESVFDSVDYYAGHVVPFGAVTSNLVLT